MHSRLFFYAVISGGMAFAMIVPGACSGDELAGQDEISEEQLPPLGNDQLLQPNLNSPSIIKSNEIVRLEVQNCIENSGCFRHVYTYNDCGGIERSFPPMIASHFYYEYDADCRVIAMIHSDSMKWRYRYLGGDTVLEKIYDPPLDTFGRDSASVYSFCELHRRDNAEYDENGRIMAVNLGDMFYPCGIEMRGRHRAIFHYHENGLISSIKITNEKRELVVAESYSYMRRDSTFIE